MSAVSAWKASPVPVGPRASVERVTGDVDTDIYLAAARRLGLEYEIIDPDAPFCRIHGGGRELLLNEQVLGFTTRVTRRLTHDKYLTLRLFREAGLPVPEARLFSLRREREEAVAYALAQRPVVIKPRTGSFERGVTIDPPDEASIRAAVEQVSALGRRYVQVEELIRGDDYRVLFFRDAIIGVVRWVQPFVDGNGRDPLAHLIETKTAWRKAHGLPSIRADRTLLAANGIASLDYVPARDERVFLNEDTGHRVGGETLRVPLESVHPDNVAIFRRAWQSVRLTFGGIDFISPDIGVPFHQNGAAFNEINTCPSIYPHTLADGAVDLGEAERILELHFFSAGAAADDRPAPEQGRHEAPSPNWIVVLNGVTCAGKSALARAIVERVEAPTMHLSLDAYHQALAARYATDQWPLYESLCLGLARSATAWWQQGFNVVVDTVLERRSLFRQMRAILPPGATRFVGVNASLETLLARAERRPPGDRKLIRFQFPRVGPAADYGLEISSEHGSAEELARRVVDYLQPAPQPARRVETPATDGPAGSALEGLRRIELEDGLLFRHYAEKARCRGWLHYFPFLFAFARTPERDLFWEALGGSLLVYHVMDTRQGPLMRLYFPPVPFSPEALQLGQARCREFNRDRKVSIVWAEADEQRRIAEVMKLKGRQVDSEYLYDTQRVVGLSGSAFAKLRAKLRRAEKEQGLTIRPYRPDDRPAAETLIEAWRSQLRAKGIAGGGHRLARTAVREYERFDRDLLRGQVVTRGDRLHGLTLGGPISRECASIFVAIADHELPGLGYLQRFRFIADNTDFPLFNDAGDLGRPHLAELKRAFAPVEENPLFRLTLR